MTGAGMITSLGLDRETTWRAVREGRCGCGPFTAMEQALPEGKDGGQALDLPADFDPGKPREVRYLRRAILDALGDAGFAASSVGVTKLPYDPGRCGLLFGTTLHGIRGGGQFLRTGDYDWLRQFLAANVLRDAARDLPFAGIAATTCSACSSSLGSIALGVTLLRSGQLDLVVAGGYDPVSEYVYGGFNSLRLVSEGPLRPFARGRSGMKLAEGYGVVVLERASDARRRGANRPLARVLGFGESADAHHLTQPHPQGDGAARAVLAALASAGLGPQDIDLIAAHATGTPDNDAGEFAAFSRAFGEELSRVPVVGFKSHLGHTLGGAGAVELILAAMALRDGIVPVCANVRAEEVEFAGLNLSTGAPRPAALRTSLNTSLGFGGANTCVILGKGENVTPSPLSTGERAGVRGSSNQQSKIRDPQSEEPLTLTLSPAYRGEGTRGRSARDVFISGVGVVLPGAIGNDAFSKRLASDSPDRVTRDTGAIPDDAITHLLNARRVRRMSGYVKLSLAATTLAFRDAGIADVPAFAETCAAVVGTTHGSADYCADYYGQIVREGIPAANPMLFAEGVPNAAAAHLSLMLALKGACQTIIGSRTAALDALRLAAARVSTGEWERAVVSAGEEYNPTVNAAYRHCGLYAGDFAEGAAGPFERGAGFVTGCGAVTLVLESRESMRARGASVPPRGTIEACASASSFGERREEIDSAARVLRALGNLAAVVSSANGTWLDRVEAGALRHAAPRNGSRRGSSESPCPTLVSSMYGHMAETFSVGPLAVVAAVLLTGKLPTLFGPGPGGRENIGGAGLARATAAQPAPESLGVLCTDYVGLVSGCRVGLCERAGASRKPARG
jgi:3-oxoacyl-[acyl-carrier-protein] synthase II